MTLGHLTLPLLMMIPFDQETANLRLRITFFEVPSIFVSRIVAGRVDKDGTVAGTMVGGNTTGSFPTKTVFLQDRLAGSADSGDIIGAIREYMAAACIREQDIEVFELTRHDLVLNDKLPIAIEADRGFEQWPHQASYRLILEPARQNEEEAGLALQLWLRWQDPYGIQDISGQVPKRLVVDQILTAKFGQTSLLGFPSSTLRSRRSIYWLSLFVEKNAL